MLRRHDEAEPDALATIARQVDPTPLISMCCHRPDALSTTARQADPTLLVVSNCITIRPNLQNTARKACGLRVMLGQTLLCGERKLTYLLSFVPHVALSRCDAELKYGARLFSPREVGWLRRPAILDGPQLSFAVFCHETQTVGYFPSLIWQLDVCEIPAACRWQYVSLMILAVSL